jgi:phage-related protein
VPLGFTVDIGADSSKFQKELRKMDKDIKSTGREVKDLTKSLAIEWDSKRFVAAQKKAQEALKQTESKADVLRQRLRHLDEAGTSKSSAEYRKLESQLTQVEAKAVQMKAELQKINQMKFDHLSGQIKSIGDGFTKAGQAMTPVSAAAAAIIAGFTKIATSAIKAGDEIGTTAQQLNLSTDQLQRWLYIAEQTDVDSSQFVNAVGKMQGALAHLAAGEEDITATALKDLGFTAEEAALGMEANFERIVNSLADVEDATLQAYYANELFGTRMGAKIIPLLNDGGNGLATLASEFENFGYLTEEQVVSLDAFEDLMQKLKYQFDLVKNQIGVALLPVMQNMANYIQETIIPAVQSLKDKLSTFSEEQLQNGLKILALVAAMAPVLLIIGKLTSGVGGLIAMIPKIAAALNVLAAHPIIAVIGVIIGLMLYLYNTNEQFKNSIDGLVMTLSATLMPVINMVMQLFKQLLSVIMPIINALGNQLALSIRIIILMITPLIQLLQAIVLPILNVIFSVLEMLISVIMGPLTAAIEWLSKLWTKGFEIIQNGIDAVLGWIESTINKAIDFINKIIREINKLGDVLGFTIGELDHIALEAEILQKVKTEVTPSNDEPAQQVIDTVSEATNADQITEMINNLNLETSPQTVVNNDNSSKDIKIEVYVQNYSEKVDVDDLVNEINIRLAESM